MSDFETIRDAQADLVLAKLHYAVLFDDTANVCVTTLEDSATGDLSIPVTADSAGIIEKKAGVSLTHTIDSNDVEAYGEADPVRTIISKRFVDFDAEYLETNKVVLEKFWGTIFDSTNFQTSAHGGVTLEAPALPKNIFYRCYLVATDDVNGADLFSYYILPRVKLVKVDNQDAKDNDATSYKMTFRAYRDSTMGFAVLQGWCGPGWRKLVHKTGFVAAPTAITATPSTPSVTAATGVGHTQQLTVTGDNSVNYTPDATYVSSAPAKATVSASGLITGVAAGTATITVTLTGFSGSPLTSTVTVTVT